jgi:colanic acid/amylovoran biosynthesis glycosyltransferase
VPSSTARARAGDASAGVGAPIAVLLEHYPELSQTFVVAELEALRRLGRTVRVEARRRAPNPNPEVPPEIPSGFLQDDARPTKAIALARLGLTRPARTLATLADQRRWMARERVEPVWALAPLASRLRRAGVRHLHVHFAFTIALDALRLGRLLALPYSLTAHAHDIYVEPIHLREKLEGAAFATSGCDYTVRHLRELVGSEHRERIHKIVMGVDVEGFARRTPYPGGRTVVAVGRLVEKKGFAYLLEAAARLEPQRPLERLVVVGDGPLRADLEEQRGRLGLERRVELVGARTPREIRDLLERADLLAMPSVVASNGDRDSMPVVVKEALAMEIPVIASDEVGLPELVKREWGRLVPPGDAFALAHALDEVASLSREERIGMGRRGREWVIEHCNVDRETAKLAALIDASAAAWR